MGHQRAPAVSLWVMLPLPAWSGINTGCCCETLCILAPLGQHMTKLAGGSSTGSKCPALLQEGLFEEAQLLRERELEMKAKLVGALSAVKHAPQHRDAGLVRWQLHRAPVHSTVVHLPGCAPFPATACLCAYTHACCSSVSALQQCSHRRQDGTTSHIWCLQVGPATERSTAVPAVGVDDVRAVISAWTQIPIERLTDDEQARLLGLEDSLQVC